MKDSELKEAADPVGLEMDVGYHFKDRALLMKALTHSSFCNEAAEPVSDNERLEFLGDAIISTVVAESAFRQFPDAREGELTRLKSVVVAEPGLAERARDIHLGKYLRLGHGAATADSAASHPGVLCDAFEALIGAIFLDGGFDAARTVVLRFLAEELVCARAEGRQIDSKTELNMAAYAMTGKPPTYSTVETRGPAHAPTFLVEVRLAGGATFRGEGNSKKAAQQAAAADAMKSIRGNPRTEANNEAAT